MDVIVEHGGYRLRNLGDVAMLTVAVRRVRAAWPQARVHVPIEDELALARHLPGTLPMAAWPAELPALVPASVRGGVRVRSKAATRHAARLPGPVRARSRWGTAVEGADLVVAAGGGYTTDVFWSHGAGVLGVLEAAQAHGVPTAMAGAGIGPLVHPARRRRAGAVLAALDVLSVREPESLRLARALGARHAVLTGDDALLLVADGTPRAAGDRLGVNVRGKAYAGMGGRTAELRAALAAAAEAVAAEVEVLPVLVGEPGDDVDATLAVVPGAAEPEVEDIPTLLHAVARCRVVVASSYHCGVFALARGIPVVLLAGSDYYEQKLGGLAELFPGAVRVVRTDRAELADDLVVAVRAAWRAPDGVRAGLAARAAELAEVAHERWLCITGSAVERAA